MKFSRVLIWRSLESLTKVNVLIFQTGIFCRKANSDFDGIDDGTAVGNYRRTTLYGGCALCFVFRVRWDMYGGKNRLGSIHRTPTGHLRAMYGGVQGHL